jgi:2-methylfumaryl-CoA isomerase
MYNLLSGMRVIEGSSFVASPICGLFLAQMGVEVIRFDQIGGGPDFGRWPLAPNSGESLYWEGLNANKKSVAIDLTRPEGRELAQRLAASPGSNGGLFLTNYPVDGFLSHERLCALRPDLVTVRIMGQANGEPALDYTVNCSVGIPQITGPALPGAQPVNHVLPAWDLLTGAYSAFSLLAGERYRRDTGRGQEIRVPLADMGISAVAYLGMVAEVVTSGANRERYGNEVFGAFGRDFVTADQERIMLMAMTPRQWRDMVRLLQIDEAIGQIESALNLSFATDEGLRFAHRARITPIVEAAVARRSLPELSALFDKSGVCWAPYKTMHQASSDPALVSANPIFSTVTQKSGMTYPVAGAPATIPGAERRPSGRAPQLGEHTDEVLLTVLGLASGEIGRLHDAKIVSSSEAAR